MSKVLSLRLNDEQYERLQRAARRLSRTPSESAVVLIEEALRQQEFPLIEFRDTILGRVAFLKGSRLKLWQIVWINRLYEGDLAKTAEHLGTPELQVRAALDYAAAYPNEIDAAMSDHQAAQGELISLVPHLQIFTVADEDSA